MPMPKQMFSVVGTWKPARTEQVEAVGFQHQNQPDGTEDRASR